MNRLIACVAAGVLLLTTADAYAARCTGSASCRACSNCSSCAHCKAGGTCGVCARNKAQPPAAPPRAETEAERRARERAAALQAARERADAELRRRQQDTAPAAPAAPGGLAGPSTRPAAAVVQTPAAQQDGITVYFSPNGGCTAAIVDQIGKARASLQVQAYRLTSPPVAKAILDAHKRGVRVTILLDKTQQSTKYSDATFYHNMGMTVLIDRSHAIAHNKVMLIDGATVITGSFNFSAAAETSNAENLLVIEGKPALAAAYVENFENHRKHCEPYRPPAGTPAGTPTGSGSGRADGPDPAGEQADGSGGGAAELLRAIQ